jgi:hypothetical protein
MTLQTEEVSMFRIVNTLVVAIAVAAGGWALDSTAAGGRAWAAASPDQQEAPESAGKGKTAKKKKEAEDPVSTKSWAEMMKDWQTVRPVPKEAIIRIDDKYCYPHGYAAFKVEIVKEDEDTVWIRGLPPEDPNSPLHKMWLQREGEELQRQHVQELLDEHGKVAFYLDFEEEIVPPPFMDSLSFELASSGLPTAGLWQMNFALDDINEDGIDDIVLPPSRKGRPRPWIYLGSSDGTFSQWREVKWSQKVPFDYGGVATADFDGDGHRDVALAIHLKAQYILYGDGSGGFERSERLPSPDPRISSRAPAVADFDGDGRKDLAFIAEIDYDLGSSKRIEDAATVWVVRNLESGWKLDVKGLPRGVIGDNIKTSDLNNDGRPDLLLGSNAANYRGLVFLNSDEGWQGQYSRGVLSNAFHYDVGKFSTRRGPPLLYWTFVQFRAVEGENVARTGVIPYHLTERGLETPTGPVFFDDNRYNPVFRIAVGDLNDDGRPDLVVSRKKGGLTIFVQTESGKFYREQSPELDQTGRAYHIKIVDVDGDGRNDIMASFAQEDKQAGGIQVWLAKGRS